MEHCVNISTTVAQFDSKNFNKIDVKILLQAILVSLVTVTRVSVVLPTCCRRWRVMANSSSQWTLFMYEKCKIFNIFEHRWCSSIGSERYGALLIVDIAFGPIFDTRNVKHVAKLFPIWLSTSITHYTREHDIDYVVITRVCCLLFAFRYSLLLIFPLVPFKSMCMQRNSHKSPLALCSQYAECIKRFS